MKTEKTTPAKTEATTTTEPGTYATKIFVFYQDPANDNQKGLTEFSTKPELDTWLKQTNVTVLRVIRGREKTIATRVVFQ